MPRTGVSPLEAAPVSLHFNPAPEEASVHQALERRLQPSLSFGYFLLTRLVLRKRRTSFKNFSLDG